jgi:hypothetical protein
MRLVREGSVASVISNNPGATSNVIPPGPTITRADSVPPEGDNDMDAYEELILGMNVQLALEDLQK